MNPTQRRLHVVIWVLVLVVALTLIVLGALLRRGPRPTGPNIDERTTEPTP
ncbi:MAG: hypothetical protein NCW75_09030 [Phycisphaera sp.]|nr:MAG: hypothetical protein NCW75_09030 [Phycisphaera sp.]